MRRTRATARRTAAVAWLTTPAKPRSTRRVFALMLAVILWSVAVASPSAQGQTFKVLYSFVGYPTDGAQPAAGLVMDAAGNLYGTTRYGGSHEGCPRKGNAEPCLSWIPTGSRLCCITSPDRTGQIPRRA